MRSHATPPYTYTAGGALLDRVNLLTPSPRLRLSSIDFRRLPTPGAVYTKMLQSIVYEYFFDRRNGNGNGTTDDAPPDPPTMVKNWAGVDGAGLVSAAAIAASTALPPRFRISAPASADSGWAVTIMAR